MNTSITKEGPAFAEVRQYFQDRISNFENIYYQLLPEDLIMQSVEMGEGILSDTGALVINTGEFTGRSPKDRFIVKDDLTAESVNWNEFNQPVEGQYFDLIFRKMVQYLNDKKLWVRDCYVCAAKNFRLSLRVVNENPCCNLFAYNMFLRPKDEEVFYRDVDWQLIHLPHFFADAKVDGVNRKNFVILNFTEKIILIGGTQYTGEIKKAVFSILNFILPRNHNVLTMHCAANAGKEGDTALFFGLSGTGKTTLSTDPLRRLIGDDEHGWNDDFIFNMEGGCYAKTINLIRRKEPEIFNAIRFGAIAENVHFLEDTNSIDFSSSAITENTRASYPIDYISNAVKPSIGGIPENIFFLTADAYGVLPPISRLSVAQAIYHFISGYTAKVAGTEEGIASPTPTFSACFSAPFIPLHPTCYAEMLGNKIKAHGIKVWMVNTGWFGGQYGTGERMKLEHTRAMISAAIEGRLDMENCQSHPSFGMMIPSSCPGVPSEILNPELAWKNKQEYYNTANQLAGYFIKNFEKYCVSAGIEIVNAGPKILNE